MIKAGNLTKTFDKFRALDNMNINVKKGSVYGLVGPNGAGKTTFIKTLMGIYKADGGELEIDGQNVYENNDIKQKVFYISDNLFFFTSYSIKQMAKFYAGMYQNWSWEVYENLKKVFNIDDNRRCIRLSKGMQKQVAFWLGISTQPEIMVLDEPVDGLDPVMRKNVWAIMLQTVAENQMTVLVSSHNLRELEDVCDHVGIMHEGKVVIERALDDVKGEIFKLQTAFSLPDVPEGMRKRFNILHESKFGSIYTFIIKGSTNDIEKYCKDNLALICDVVPLTLEEIFIYELGGMGYEFKNILV